jgi:hypothetical protein
MRQLRLLQILEHYDVPQILTAVDATGTRYLCVLYDNSEDKGYKYLGVQLSENRLQSFISGQLDLRDAYLHPEVENALYIVDVKNETLMATEMSGAQDLNENMLPEVGYFYDESDMDNISTASDTYQLEVPISDRTTFSTLVSRMGWRASSLRKTVGVTATI